MRTKFLPPFFVLLVPLLGGKISSSEAQDNVTVPKSRLEELERKEKELERLKGDHARNTHDALPPKAENQNVGSAAGPAAAVPKEPAPSYVSTPMASLSPLQPFDLVESMDLANYYHDDTASADQRFLKQKLTVRGEIVGFEKPHWKRNYRILLKTPSRETRVMCDFLPPEGSSGVFTIKHGDELVAVMGEKRVPIASVGQHVVVKGECRGLNDSVVTILAWDLKPDR